MYAAYSEQDDSQSFSYQLFNFAKSSRYVPHTSTLRIPNMDLYNLHQHWYSAWIPLSCIWCPNQWETDMSCSDSQNWRLRNWVEKSRLATNRNQTTHYNTYDMSLDDVDCGKNVHLWKDNFSVDGLWHTKWSLLIVYYSAAGSTIVMQCRPLGKWSQRVWHWR